MKSWTATSRSPRSAGRSRLTVELGELAFQSLGGPEDSVDVFAARLGRVVRIYLADRDANRPGWKFPALVQEKQAERTVSVMMALNGDALEELEMEAGRCSVSVDQMVGHAALYYLAELDAGRLTQRILDDFENS